MRAFALPGQGRSEEPEWVVWLVVAVALLLGLLLESLTLGRTQVASAGQIQVSYPASWVRTQENGATLAAADRNQGGPLGARVVIRDLPKAQFIRGQATVTDAATNWSLDRAKQLLGYRVLRLEPDSVNGHDAVTLEYAYLADASQGAVADAPPTTVRALDTLVESGGRLYILTFAAEPDEFARLTSAQFPRFRSVYADLHQSWRFP